MHEPTASHTHKTEMAKVVKKFEIKQMHVFESSLCV